MSDDQETLEFEEYLSNLVRTGKLKKSTYRILHSDEEEDDVEYQKSKFGGTKNGEARVTGTRKSDLDRGRAKPAVKPVLTYLGKKQAKTRKHEHQYLVDDAIIKSNGQYANQVKSLPPPPKKKILIAMGTQTPGCYEHRFAAASRTSKGESTPSLPLVEKCAGLPSVSVRAEESITVQPSANDSCPPAHTASQPFTHEYIGNLHCPTKPLLSLCSHTDKPTIEPATLVFANTGTLPSPEHNTITNSSKQQLSDMPSTLALQSFEDLQRPTEPFTSHPGRNCDLYPTVFPGFNVENSGMNQFFFNEPLALSLGHPPSVPLASNVLNSGTLLGYNESLTSSYFPQTTNAASTTIPFQYLTFPLPQNDFITASYGYVTFPPAFSHMPFQPPGAVHCLSSQPPASSVLNFLPPLQNYNLPSTTFSSMTTTTGTTTPTNIDNTNNFATIGTNSYNNNAGFEAPLAKDWREGSMQTKAPSSHPYRPYYPTVSQVTVPECNNMGSPLVTAPLMLTFRVKNTRSKPGSVVGVGKLKC